VPKTTRRRNRSAPRPAPDTAASLGDVGECAICDKHMYRSRAAARKAGRVLHPENAIHVYACGAYWHLTSSSARSMANIRRVQSQKISEMERD
jgi:hypothetical protein